MDCPKCSAELGTRLFEAVEIEECSRCKGAWFDGDALRKAKDSRDADLNWMDFDLWKQADRFKGAGARYACPKCGGKMYALGYADTDVEVDCCEQHCGLWLDEGEFARIVGALQKELSSKPIDDYVKATLKEAAEIVAGPESLASEWKDFATVLRMLQYRILADKPTLHKWLVSAQRSSPLQ